MARPVTPVGERAEILAALAAVDYVTEFEGESPYGFLARLLPDVVVMGGSAGTNGTAARDSNDFKRLECKVVRVALEPGYSTEILIERILESRS